MTIWVSRRVVNKGAARKGSKTYVDQNSRQRRSRRGQLEWLGPGYMQDDANRPAGEDVEEPYETEEELHVDTSFVLDANLQEDNIKGVEQSGDESQSIA
jgi:hypothetical protein